MLRLIVGLLLLVPILAVVALAMVLDGAPQRAGPPQPEGNVPVPATGAEARAGAGGVVNVHATIELPPEFPRRYLNIEVDAERTERDGLPAIRRVAVGAVDVPRWLADQAMRMAFDRWPVLKDERLRLAVVRAVRSYPDRLDLVCDWPQSPVQRVRVRAVPDGSASGNGSGGGSGAYAGRIAAWAGAETGPRAPALGLLRSLVAEAAGSAPRPARIRWPRIVPRS